MSGARIVFVLSPFQNAFFHELADALAGELTDAGADALVTTEPADHQVTDDDVFVLVPPHEYVALEGRAFVDHPVVAARTIGLSAEQPHQVFFTANVEVGRGLGAAIDFSALAVQRMRELGLPARHLAFGYTRRWDRYATRRIPAEGPPRVLYLGNKQPRRLGVLAAAAPALARHRATLLVSDNESPNRGTGPTFVAGDDKRALLASTRLLVNVHQSDEPYFEWLRFVEAAHCGAPVLSEVSRHSEPFVPDVHFATFDGDLGERLDALVDDDDRLAELAAAAYERLRAMPLSTGLSVLVDAAGGLLASPPPAHLPGRTRTVPIGAARVAVPSTGRPSRPRRARIGRRRRSQAVLVSSGSPRLLDALGPRFDAVDHLEPGALRGVDLDGRADTVVVAPAGSEPLQPAFDEMVERFAADHVGRDVALISAVIAGRDADGRPTLEGHWPWETWRLSAGQHLGRLLLVRGDVVRAVLDPRREGGAPSPPADAPLHLRVQWWAASHAMRGLHLPCPVAVVNGEPLDPTQAAGTVARTPQSEDRARTTNW